MKAWCVSIKDDDDQGMLVVFANTREEARSQSGDLQYERWIDIRAVRDKRYDGLEKLSDAELALRQWRDGWRWFDMDYPDQDEATDAEFLKWYEANF